MRRLSSPSERTNSLLAQHWVNPNTLRGLAEWHREVVCRSTPQAVVYHCGHAILLLGSLTALACGTDESLYRTSFEGASTVGRDRAGIVYGSDDTAHDAVVAVLAIRDNGPLGVCSGTVVQVKDGIGYVLTAAHCCMERRPQAVVLDVDYQLYERDVGRPNPNPPVYAVLRGSVTHDPDYNGLVHDFCMLRFAGANTDTPSIQAAATDDELQIGSQVEFVGFGITEHGDENSHRHHAFGTLRQITRDTVEYGEGQGIGGPCAGDSGGPALSPVGAAHSEQTLVAVTSYGDQECRRYGVSSRVTSATGPNGFITRYLNDELAPADERGDEDSSIDLLPRELAHPETGVLARNSTPAGGCNGVTATSLVEIVFAPLVMALRRHRHRHRHRR